MAASKTRGGSLVCCPSWHTHMQLLWFTVDKTAGSTRDAELL